MELRHLRYFIAVAEEGSLTLAAEKRLHTAQPSLSRQIRDLERDVGAKLLIRRARGIELTEAGQVFLDHARLCLAQVEAAGDAARWATQSDRPAFVLGMLTGYEMEWLPAALRILRDELPNIEVTLASQSSPELAGALLRGKVDVAFLRREQAPGLVYRLLDRQPIVAVLPRGHRLAEHKTIRLADMAGETYISPTKAAPVLKVLLAKHAASNGVRLTAAHEAENLTMAISLVVSTGGVSLLPLYAQNLLPPSVVWRPLEKAPAIDLVMGYSRSNTSALLKRFIARADEMIARARPARQAAS